MPRMARMKDPTPPLFATELLVPTRPPVEPTVEIVSGMAALLLQVLLAAKAREVEDDEA